MNEEVEVVQSHPYQDIYRLQPGILLKINKYKTDSFGIYGKKVPLKKVKGLKDGYILTADYLHWGEKFYSKGTIILESSAVFPVPKEQYWFELKFSGGAFQGSFEEYRVLNKKVEIILEGY